MMVTVGEILDEITEVERVKKLVDDKNFNALMGIAGAAKSVTVLDLYIDGFGG